MKKAKDFLSGRFVLVPADLTSDPIDKRGEIGIIEKIDQSSRTAIVLFKDGMQGKYQLDAIDTPFPYRALLYRFQMHYASMKYDEIEIVKRIIETSAKCETQWALQMASFDEVIKGICVTDCDTVYEMQQDLNKSLGIPTRRLVTKAQSKLLGRIVKILQTDLYRIGEFGFINDVDMSNNKASLLLKNGKLQTYDLNGLLTLNPLKVIASKFEKQFSSLSNNERETLERVVDYMLGKRHLWAIELALSSSPIVKEVSVTDLKSYYQLKKSKPKKLGFPRHK